MAKETEQQTMEEYLLSQLDTPVVLKDGTMMTKPDGIAMLPGWQASRGAQIENYVACHFPMMGISKAAAEEIERIK